MIYRVLDRVFRDGQSLGRFGASCFRVHWSEQWLARPKQLDVTIKQESKTRECCERQTALTEKTWEWHAYTDKGRSAKNTDRPAFQKLMADI